MLDYSSKDYWRGLHARADLTAVGQSGLPEGVNTWIYRSIRRNLRLFARRHGLAAAGSQRMLEVGVGTGYWIPFWQRLGWQVDGCDLVPDAVDRLRVDHPDARFWVADVSDPAGVLRGSEAFSQAPREGYDLVTATSVLLHVTKDDEFERALSNLAAVVRPGGHLLLVEPALTRKRKQPPFDPTKHSRARVLRSYRQPLRALGLELMAVEPTTVLAANPLEARSRKRLRRYRSWWRLVNKSRQRPAMGLVLGPVMYAADGVLMRTSEAPTSKLLLFRRTP